MHASARILLALAGCQCGGGEARTLDVGAARWPAADAAFEVEPRWLGADGAYSVALEDGRALWLFGDTFVARGDVLTRRESAMVRNTVALQTGDDPTTASMRMFWRERDGEPDAFVPGEGEHWLWPLHGIAIDGALVLFFLREAPSNEGLGFTAAGWTARRIADTRGPPDTWTVASIETPETPGLVVGTAVLATEAHVLAYVVEEPGNHAIRLLRWDRDAFATGNLLAPSWWVDGSWVAHADLEGRASIVFGDAQTEISVVERDGRFVAVYTLGFGSTTIGLRTAPAPEGPWSEVRSVFRPPESDRDDAFVYAAKAHGWIRAPGGALAVTYAANAKVFGDLVADTSLYWPRFVTLSP
jgi:hypothetical protein